MKIKLKHKPKELLHLCSFIGLETNKLSDKVIALDLWKTYMKAALRLPVKTKKMSVSMEAHIADTLVMLLQLSSDPYYMALGNLLRTEVEKQKQVALMF